MGGASTIERTTVVFDWNEFMKYAMSNIKIREKIGPAWLFLFDIFLSADETGTYFSTYSDLARRYGVAPITVKKWRSWLCKQAIIDTFSKGHSVVIRLQEPFRSYLKSVSKLDPSNQSMDVIIRKLAEALQKNPSD